MNIVNCILVEDELPAAEELMFMLNSYSDLKIIGVCRDGKEALKTITEQDPDVVFLDINIPIINGVELANRIIELDKNIHIVFTTSFEEHAIKAFEIEALDYLLKPFDESRVSKTVKRIRAKINNNNDTSGDISEKVKKLIGKLDREDKLLKKIPCSLNERIVLINTKDIYFFYAEGDKTYAKTTDKTYLTKHTLTEFENKTEFFRCHKSYLVNTEKITELYPWFNGAYQLSMGDKENSQLPVSRSHVKDLKLLLGI
jgi:two-component system, LytTR family, response regulator LytT